MYEEFVDEAMREIWCSPYMDRPSVLLAKRIAPKEGIRREFKLPWTLLRMPNQDERFYLYQIGHVPNSFFGIKENLTEWTLVSDIVKNDDLHVDIYIKNGMEIPRSHVFFKRHENTFYVVIRHHEHMPDMRLEDIYIRFYSNSFTQSVRSEGLTPILNVNGVVVETPEAAMGVLNEFYDAVNGSIGFSYIQHNGYLSGHLTPAHLSVGDSIEFLHDKSVKRVVDFNLKDLPVFTSVLDNKAKYLLHPPKTEEMMIDFYDDIDVLLIVPDSQKQFVGVRYHANATPSKKDAVRMVTHRDLSIPTDYVEEYISNHPDVLNHDELIIRLIVRHSGFERPLGFNSSKTNELYKLDDEEIVNLLGGFDATFPEWRAENLEKATHTLLYSKKTPFILAEVMEAYGYDASMKFLFDSPVKPITGDSWPSFKVPVGHRESSTFYEYNSEGLLLSTNSIFQGTVYRASSPRTSFVEIHRGRTNKEIDLTVNQLVVPHDPTLTYSYYLLTTVANSDVEGNWVEAVEGVDFNIRNGNVRWEVDLRLKTPLVVSDKVALGYTTTTTTTDGLIRHQIVRTDNSGEGEIEIPLEVPLGKLDLWLNNNALIEGLDYVMTTPTEVLIFSKEYVLLDKEEQTLVVRWAGHDSFGYGDFTDKYIGIVNQGLLSANDKFDVKDDRLIRCVVGGKVRLLDSLTFEEEHSGILDIDTEDGTPYMIELTKPPMWELDSVIPVDYRANAMDLNSRLSDLLTLKVPAPEKPMFIATDRRYTLFSPFISAILAKMKEGEIEVEHRTLKDDELASLVLPYLPLLEFDPSLLDLPINKDLTKVHPHPFLEDVMVTLYEYNVLERLSLMYLDGKVDMTQHVTIGEPC